MLTLTAPTPINGDLLTQQLGSAGIPTTVVLAGDKIELAKLSEANRAAAQQVVDSHPVTAQAALDTATAQRANESTIRDRADAALVANTTYLAIASPTSAQVSAQVKALTKQNQGLIRLVLQRFNGTD